ncbi:MAG TPA: PA domain-containing protein [Gaiellaceae bacterium]|nr:PA domain-containing protein [Gaiellaceae bacterium]
MQRRPDLNAGAVDPGDIAVVRRGECTFAEKMANAAALGAASIVVSNNIRTDTPWGGVRIWDYTDPENPVLASTYNTVCSADPHDHLCDPRGTYSVHNVIVEKGKAYFSWYSDGVIVLDISDPYNPVETARYHRAGEEFEHENGGIQDVWGIYKERGKPWLYASDRNGGLYVLKEYGAGSGQQGNP